MSQIRSLQVLRVLAASGVAYYHTHAAPSFGGAGVDIFFTLSGFIIAMLLTDPTQTPLQFARGRITRVVPLYWAVTLLLFAVLLVQPALFHSTKADTWDLLRSLLFIPYDRAPVLQVGWTLNYEMSFYALACLCLWLRQRVLVLALALVAIFTAASIVASPSAYGEFLMNPRLLEFALGIAIHEAVRRNWLPPAIPAALLLLAGFACLIGAEIHDPSSAPFLRFGLPAALIVWSALALERFVAGPWANGLVVLGDASYALYLTHSIVVEGCRRLGFTPSPAGSLLTVGIAITVSYLVYQFLDRALVHHARTLFDARRRRPIERA